MRKLLRVDMAELSIKEDSLPSEKKPTGGRHLTSSIVSSEVSATCHPLSAHNKLVLAPGWLAGTEAPCSDRLSVGAKSPLTSGVKQSNVGSNVGIALSRLGWIRYRPNQGLCNNRTTNFLRQSLCTAVHNALLASIR